MLQYQRQVICLAILMLATHAAVFSQDSQHEGSAEAQELAITGATLIDGTGAAPRSSTTILIREPMSRNIRIRLRPSCKPMKAKNF